MLNIRLLRGRTTGKAASNPVEVIIQQTADEHTIQYLDLYPYSEAAKGAALKCHACRVTGGRKLSRISYVQQQMADEPRADLAALKNRTWSHDRGNSCGLAPHSDLSESQATHKVALISADIE